MELNAQVQVQVGAHIANHLLVFLEEVVLELMVVPVHMPAMQMGLSSAMHQRTALQ